MISAGLDEAQHPRPATAQPSTRLGGPSLDWYNRIDALTKPRWFVIAGLVAVLLTAGGLVMLLSDDSPTPSQESLDANTSTDEGAILGGGTPLHSLDDTYEDSDNDGLPDLLENYVYGTDAQDPFSTNTTIPDGWFAKHGYDPMEPGIDHEYAAYPGPSQAPEAYGPDGLDPEYRMTLAETYAWDKPEDWDEATDGPWDNGLDPTRWDQGAGLPFTWLIHHDLDPVDPSIGDEVLDPEPEGTGLTVQESYRTATDPRATDTDNDGLPDDVELDETGTDPSSFSTTGRGIADGWAIEHGLEPTSASMAFQDPDNDGLTNQEEFQASVDLVGLNATLNGEGLDPHEATSGASTIPDGWVAEMGLDPFDSGIDEQILERSTDYGPANERGLDEVMLTVKDAYEHDRPESWSEPIDGPWMGGLSAKTNDTDGDGLPDAVEIAGWTVNVTLGTGPSQDTQDRQITSNPKRVDTDADGLTDLQEFRGRVNVDEETFSFAPIDPTSRDTDFDGLSDRVEVIEIPKRANQAGIEGQTLSPTKQDTDQDGLADGPEEAYWTNQAAAYRSGATAYGFDHRDDDGVAILGSMPGARGPGGVATQATVADALEPWGDLDDDDQINVLDPDADGDELNDGWEIDPSKYAQSPFASEHERPETDPANEDTDGDELPDGWEIRFGEWDLTLETWNLDPSTWDSFDDGTPDGERDLDDDGITWHTFHFTGSRYESEDHAFEATNRIEHEHGTDPNDASTPGNGLLDGWTIFWGHIYPDKDATELGDIYPGAPGPLLIPPDVAKPSPDQEQVPATDRTDRFRFATENAPQRDEVLETAYNGIQDASTGESQDVYKFRERVQYTFLDEQGHQTNPYVLDTDADGAPDAWETAYAAGGPTPDPLTFERDEDHDDDGLTLEEEHRARTDPTREDTDRGGVPDGEEANPDAPADPLDPRDDVRLRDASVDTDGDGIPDIDEVQGWTHPELGEIETDPTDADTDGDGLLDGDHLELDPEDPDDASRIEKFQRAGLVHTTRDDGTVRFSGEVGWGGDPRAASTPEDGVPDGWRAHWRLSPDAAELDPSPFYEHARPIWWDEATMGPWWWGLAPSFDADVDEDETRDVERVGNTFKLTDLDLDEDGLSDVNGEDPTPAARPETRPPAGFPHEDGLDAETTRERATGFGVPVGERGHASDRDIDDDGVPDAHDQAPARLDAISIHAPDADEGIRVQAGTAYNATGHVTVEDADGQPAPVPNATVAVHLGGPGNALGYGATDEQGRFDVSFQVQTHQEQAQAPPGIAFEGQSLAPIEWSVDLEKIELGPGDAENPNQLRLQVYNTSGHATPKHPTYLGVPTQLDLPKGGTAEARANGIQGTVSDPIPFTFEADSLLKIDAPREVHVGDEVAVTVRLEDGAGSPIQDAPLDLQADPDQRTLTTDEAGQASTTFPNATPTPGPVNLDATYQGGEHRLPASNETTINVRHATSLSLHGATPVPAEAGEAITIEGTLQAPTNQTDQLVRLKVPGASTNATTDDAGRFNATLSLPEDLPPGETPLTARFPGSHDLAASSQETSLPVRGLPHLALTVLADDALSPNADAQLLVTSTVGNATPLPGEIMVKGLPSDPDPRTVEIGPDGTATVNWRIGDTLGAHLVTVQRPADDEHLEAKNQTWVSIKAPAHIATGHTDLLRGHPATLTGTLEDVLGTPIPGARIDVHIRDEPVTKTHTDDAGHFHASWTVDPDRSLGATLVTITYQPTDADPWQPATRTLTLPVKSTVHVELPDDPVLLTDPILEAALSTDTGDPLPSGTATLTLTQANVTASAPIEAGKTTLALPLSDEATPGRYDARLTLQDVPDLDPPPLPLNVTLASPVTIHHDAPSTAGRGDTLQLTPRALDERNTTLREGSYTALLDGQPVANATTTRDRIPLEIPIPDDQPTGPATLTIEWTGPPWYLDASTETTLNVLEGTHLALDLPRETQPGQRVEGTIHLTSMDGTPLPDRRVALQDDDTEEPMLVTTNDEGEATILVTPQSLDTTTLQAHYPGDEDHAPATTTHAIRPPSPTGTRGPGTGLVIVGLLALTGTAALGVWAYRRRRLQAAVADALDEGAQRVHADNEHRAVILMTYYKLHDILSDQGVVPDDTETLREYQDQIQRGLGLPKAPLQALFDVFDEALYAPWTEGPEQARRAHRAFLRVSRNLRQRLNDEENAPEWPSEADEEVHPLA